MEIKMCWWRRLLFLAFPMVFLIAGSVSAATAESRPELQLLKGLEVYSDPEIGPIQPSGLATCSDRLLMVSDRHNQQIFSLAISDDRADASVLLDLETIPDPDLSGYDFDIRWWNAVSRRYDWEGISCDDQGRIYLVSETLAQVLVREPDGKLRWLGSESYQQGRKKGLFEHINALAEGVAVSGNRMVIMAERQPRGAVVLSRHGSTQDAWKVDQVYYLSGFPSLVRPQDFSGVILEDQHVYSLERNHFQVCKRSLSDFSVIGCWGYRKTEEGDHWRYKDLRFGKAEGLARKGSELYLVLDNNEDLRATKTDNRRPLLFIFKQPDGW